MDEVMKQAPDNISREEIEIIFKKNDENITDTLIDLWKLDVPKSNVDLKDDTDKWANIRDVCDSFDLEMQTQMNRLKKH
jgi:hypothetical protein